MDQFDSTIQSIVDEINARFQKKVSIVELDSVDITSTVPENCLGISHTLEASSVIKTVLETGLDHVVQSTNPVVEDEIYASAKMITDPEAFLNSPLGSILRPKEESFDSAKDSYRMVFDSSTQKTDFMVGLQQYVSGFIKRDSMIDEVLLVADEMFSNAIFNAPFINSVGSKGVNRTSGEVKSDKQALFLAGHTENQLALCCIDQYGSLDLNALLKRIHDCYEKGADEMMDRTGEGGAGLGVFMVFNGSSSLYSLVKPGKFTLMATTIPLGLSRKKRQEIQKSLHCSEVSQDIELEHLFKAA